LLDKFTREEQAHVHFALALAAPRKETILMPKNQTAFRVIVSAIIAQLFVV
jgi:hypothetical protein